MRSGGRKEASRIYSCQYCGTKWKETEQTDGGSRSKADAEDEEVEYDDEEDNVARICCEVS